jgi:hypothetical protein
MAQALFNHKRHAIVEICRTLGIACATLYRCITAKPTDQATPAHQTRC